MRGRRHEPDDSPSRVPGYRDLAQIGRGGFSTVFTAYQEHFDRTVALKILEIEMVDEQSQRRFARECAAAGRLTGHPNIVTVFESGFTTDGKPYIAMEHFALGSLAVRLRSEGSLPLTDVLRVGVRIAGALEVAHRSGVIHRDIKPANILVSAYGEPALADFGIAAVALRDQSVNTATMTPSYSPPEVLEGRSPTVASDVYSLGATLYCLLAGRPPFADDTEPGVFALLLRVLREQVPDIERTDVPTEVVDVLRRAMAKEPRQRFASAAAFGEELRALQKRLGQPVTDMVTGLSPPPGAAPAAVDDDAPTPGANRPTAPPAAPTRAPATPPRAANEPDTAAPRPAVDPPAVPVGMAPYQIRPHDPRPPRPARPRAARSPAPRVTNRRPGAWIGGAAVVLVAVIFVAVIVLRGGRDDPPTSTIPGLSAPSAVRVDETNGGTGVHVAWTDHSDGRLQQVVYVYRDRGTTPTATQAIGAGQSDATIAIEPTVPYCFVVATVVPGSPITHLDAKPLCIRGATADISVPTG
jgi:serine/threonine protein kinase